MPFISGYKQAPYQGITQSAPAFRLPDQADSVIDAEVEIHKGFRKRPPWEWVAKPINAVTNDALTQIVIDPDDGSVWLAVIDISGGVVSAVLVNPTTGATAAVTISSAAQTYLASGTAKANDDLRMLSAIDYNFLINRKKIVANGSVTAAARSPEGLVWVKQGGYGYTYRVTVTPSVGGAIAGSIETPNGIRFVDAPYFGTNAILTGLVTGLGPDGTAWTTITDGAAVTAIGTPLTTAGYTTSTVDSVLGITGSTDFTLTSDDAVGGLALGTIKGSVQDFSSLPKACPIDGFTVEISPARADAYGSYWLKYSAANSVWQECVKPGVNLGIDTTTLPVALIKASGAWKIDVVAWKGRTVGDTNSAPDPGLIGYSINDMLFYAGRLGLVYDEGVLWTSALDPFALYPATVVTSIDSDPFETENPDQTRAVWNGATAMYGGIVLVGKFSQCFLQNADVGSFTQKSAQLRVISRYQVDNAVILRPTTINERVYLATPRDENYFAFFEFAADRLSGRILPDDVSAHVPTLLPNTLNRIAPVEPAFAVFYASSGKSSMFVGKFRYANFERVQTAWFQWNAPPGMTVSGLAEHGTFIYLIGRDANGAGHLFSLDLAPDKLDSGTGATVLTKLDARAAETLCTVSYSATTGDTTITPPLPVTSATRVAARAGSAGRYIEGYLAEIVSTTGTQIVIKGDWSAQDFYCGYSYTAYWYPGTIYRFSQDNRPITRARLTVSDILLDVTNGINVRVQTSQPSRNTRTYLRSGLSFGSPVNQFTGQWRVAINAKNTSLTLLIYDDGHLGTNISGFEWFGHQDPFWQRVT